MLERLKREFMTADRLDLTLASTAYRVRDEHLGRERLAHREQMLLSYAVSSAARFSSTWVNLQAAGPYAGLGHATVADALAGEDLRFELPDAAAALREPWRQAKAVRAQLRSLGPAVEDAALRLAPSWRLPLRELPAAAAAVTLAAAR